jgi:hypothetical protein
MASHNELDQALTAYVSDQAACFPLKDACVQLQYFLHNRKEAEDGGVGPALAEIAYSKAIAPEPDPDVAAGAMLDVVMSTLPDLTSNSGRKRIARAMVLLADSLPMRHVATFPWLRCLHAIIDRIPTPHTRGDNLKAARRLVITWLSALVYGFVEMSKSPRSLYCCLLLATGLADDPELRTIVPPSSLDPVLTATFRHSTGTTDPVVEKLLPERLMDVQLSMKKAIPPDRFREWQDEYAYELARDCLSWRSYGLAYPWPDKLRRFGRYAAGNGLNITASGLVRRVYGALLREKQQTWSDELGHDVPDSYIVNAVTGLYIAHSALNPEGKDEARAALVAATRGDEMANSLEGARKAGMYRTGLGLILAARFR